MKLSDIYIPAPEDWTLSVPAKNEEGWKLIPFVAIRLFDDGSAPVPVTVGGQVKLFLIGAGSMHGFYGPLGQFFSNLESFKKNGGWKRLKDVNGNVQEPYDEPEEPAPEAPDEWPTLRGLNVSGRACAPLERDGIVTIYDLSQRTRKSVQDTKGVSRETVKELDDLLAGHDLSWADSETQADEEEYDLADVGGVL